jgi:hypothetical protein
LSAASSPCLLVDEPCWIRAEEAASVLSLHCGSMAALQVCGVVFGVWCGVRCDNCEQRIWHMTLSPQSSEHHKRYEVFINSKNHFRAQKPLYKFLTEKWFLFKKPRKPLREKPLPVSLALLQ